MQGHEAELDAGMRENERAQADFQIVILGAGAPQVGAELPALMDVRTGATALEWIIDAAGVSMTEAIFVGGFHAEEVRKRFPQLRIVENPQWRETGSYISLITAPIDGDRPLLACYADVLFRPWLVDALRRSPTPVTVAWDSRWKRPDRPKRQTGGQEQVLVAGDRVMRAGYDIPPGWAHGEFIGVVYFVPEVASCLRELRARAPELFERAQLSDLVEYLRVQGFPIGAVDVQGDWAEVACGKDIARFILGTKSQTLDRLRGRVRHVVIQDQVSFTVKRWQQQAAAVLEEIRRRFGSGPLVVRSSAQTEDSFTTANAGVYRSVLNVDPESGLAKAIEHVIASYGHAHPDDEVLVQPMVRNVALSGVVFTRTLEYGGPWYVVNFDRTGKTDGVTGGCSSDHSTLYAYRETVPRGIGDPDLRRLLEGVQEIERLLRYDRLDIEFAVDTAGRVHVFQVRPIAALESCDAEVLDAACAAAIASARQTWARLAEAPPHFPGDSPLMFGIMPDWNPAEIIGTSPGALAESLYRHLVMDEIWAIQRAEYGYRDVRPAPLMVSIAGRPYVDVRASFASFIPAPLDDRLAARLLRFYLQYLAQHPELHDKVEFEVVPTCVAPDFSRWERRLREEGGFRGDEIGALREALLQITEGGFERWREDLVKIHQLEQRYARIEASGLPPLEKARLWLDDCRRLGTLPFAHLARGAFVAMSLMRGAQATGAISKEAVDDFLASIRTISHELTEDARAAAKGRMEWSAFVCKYGHLRPGTYDITSPRYDSDPEYFLRPLLDQAWREEGERERTGRWEEERPSFFEAVRRIGLAVAPAEVEAFLRGVIEGREYGKFIFTRNVSAALEALAAVGEAIDLPRETLSNLPLEVFWGLRDDRVSATRRREVLEQIAATNARVREVSGWCKLPALLIEEQQLEVFSQGPDHPNFVGSDRVIAHVVAFDGPRLVEERPLNGAIVMILRADPGYDWLFGQGIAGLVTMYGGANSHMAIRAAEFGLPAAIGIGEQRYRALRDSELIELDPAAHILRALR